VGPSFFMHMKELLSQWTLFLRERGVRRPVAYFLRFLWILLAMIVVYSTLFLVMMDYEGRDFSWLTGLYWTLTVMSTLGFGDITFQSDLGRLFSIIVLVSGILCLLVMLPFAFIEYIYSPWLEAQKKRETPRAVPEGLRGHVILVGQGPVVLNLAEDLARYGYFCALLCGETQVAMDLTDQGYHAYVGDYDDGETYRRLAVSEAAMLVALDNDVRNTNTVFSARETDSLVPIVARAERTESVDILELAGSSHVFQFRRLLGKALAGRVPDGRTRSSVLATMGPLMVAEAPAAGTSLVGKTLRDSDVRQRMGINVVGLWERGKFCLPRADSLISEQTILVMAGAEAQLRAFDTQAEAEAPVVPGRVIVLGGGRVGLAAARDLMRRGIDVIVVDKSGLGVSDSEKEVSVVLTDDQGEDSSALCQVTCLRGDAADLAVLERAGIRSAPAILITTHDDDTNIYLTIYCRRLRPDIRIVCRATLDRNVNILHSAGADVVLSLASMIATSVINLLSPGKLFLLHEGLNVFRVRVGNTLAGLTLGESGIRSESNCSVVVVRDTNGEMIVTPGPAHRFEMGEELYLIGDSASEDSYYQRFGREETGGDSA